MSAVPGSPELSWSFGSCPFFAISWSICPRTDLSLSTLTFFS